MAGEEYNKIHAMAYARKLVMKKFGTDLLNLWPLTDTDLLVRDLTRQRPLVGSGVALQQPGIVDYAMDVQSGYLSDMVADFGNIGLGVDAWGPTASWYAITVPPGRWVSVRFKGSRSTTYSVFVAPANTSPSNVSSKAIVSGTTSSGGGSPPVTHTWTFPFTIDAGTDQLWLYIDGVDLSLAGSASGVSGRYWTGSQWAELTGTSKPIAQFDGFATQRSLGGMDKATIGLWANFDNSRVDAVIAALATNSLIQMRLRTTAAKKIEGYVYAGGDYTLTSPEQPHPGFSLVTLSYEKATTNGVKLGLNGLVVAKATPGSFAMAVDGAVGIGALLRPNRTVSNQMTGLVVSDVFLAKNAVADADLWGIYQAFVTAAPLMTTESAA